jgi:hypothetical protein
MLLALADFCEADTSKTRRRLLKTLSQATLMFVIAPPWGGDVSRLAFTDDDQGRPMLPAFTDELHVARWLQETMHVAEAPASAFLPVLLKGPFVGLLLNPKSETAVFVGRRVVEQLVDGKLPAFSESDAELLHRW